MFNDIFRGKRVLITGNTGFKGSWLTAWLLQCGADIYGYSNGIPTEPSMFRALNLEQKITQFYADVRSTQTLIDTLHKVRPDFVFHLAAQALVSVSYENPVDTITTNVLGTTSMLEALRLADWPITAVIITSDKAYDNVEWIWGYRENDAMGGKDIYSGSKGCAELVFKSYFHSFLSKKDNLKIGVARAGNVIGGGDWSRDRIVVDTIKAFSEGKPVEIRSPRATRPWQHVLEPLSGYLSLAQALYEERIASGEAFNFGPRAEQTKTVLQLARDLAAGRGLNSDEAVVITGHTPFEEAKLLKLNCDKALAYLAWHSTWLYPQTVAKINEWYNAYYAANCDMFALTMQQINEFVDSAKEQDLIWTK